MDGGLAGGLVSCRNGHKLSLLLNPRPCNGTSKLLLARGTPSLPTLLTSAYFILGPINSSTAYSII